MPAHVTPVTHWIDPNEKCWWFVEMNLNPWQATKGGAKYEPETWSGVARYRIAWVNRGDVIHEHHVISPHPTSVPPVRIPSYWEHNYGELCGLADDYATSRRGAEADQEYVMELQAESTLVRDLYDQWEGMDLMVRNRSSFGALVKVQRDGFPQELRKRIGRN